MTAEVLHEPITNQDEKKKQMKKCKGKKKKKKSGKDRPRTVHIDVYCTASESSESESISSEGGKRCGTRQENDDDFDSDESNTSSCYTVVRKDQSAFYRNVRHVRKKNTLPQSLTRTAGASGSSKPVLSYRISAQELAQAAAASAAGRSSRERSCSQQRQLQQHQPLLPDEEQLFRDLTLTDTSIRSLLTTGEDSASDFDTSPSEYSGALRNWRSPEDERRKKMLEQRKQQWRAAKAVEESERQLINNTNNESSSISTASRDGSSRSLPVLNRLMINKKEDNRRFLEPRPLQLQLSDRILSRNNSQRCPSIDKLITNCQPPSKLSDSFSSNLSSVPSSFRSCEALQIERVQVRGKSTPPQPSTPSAPLLSNSCWPFGIPNQQQRQRSSALTKKFGHHVGPARNPDCSCAHCIDHFNRIKELRSTAKV